MPSTVSRSFPLPYPTVRVDPQPQVCFQRSARVSPRCTDRLQVEHVIADDLSFNGQRGFPPGVSPRCTPLPRPTTYLSTVSGGFPPLYHVRLTPAAMIPRFQRSAEVSPRCTAPMLDWRPFLSFFQRSAEVSPRCTGTLLGTARRARSAFNGQRRFPPLYPVGVNFLGRMSAIFQRSAEVSPRCTTSGGRRALLIVSFNGQRRFPPAVPAAAGYPRSMTSSPPFNGQRRFPPAVPRARRAWFSAERNFQRSARVSPRCTLSRGVPPIGRASFQRSARVSPRCTHRHRHRQHRTIGYFQRSARVSPRCTYPTAQYRRDQLRSFQRSARVSPRCTYVSDRTPYLLRGLSTVSEGFPPLYLVPCARRRPDDLLSTVSEGFPPLYPSSLRAPANRLFPVPLRAVGLPAHLSPSPERVRTQHTG